MKKFYITLTIFSLLFLQPIIVNANTNDNQDELFSYEQINSIYNQDPSIQVIKTEGSDVTNDFYNFLKHKSLNKDIIQIREYLINNELIISKQDVLNKRSFTNSYGKHFEARVKLTNTKNSNDYKYVNIRYDVNGTATCDNRGKILSYSDASLTKSNLYDDWYMTSISCSTTNHGNYLTISFSFIPCYDYVYMGAGIATYKGSKISFSYDYTPMY